jgi:hypothetical protein
LSYPSSGESRINSRRIYPILARDFSFNRNLTRLDQSRHITMTLRTFANKQQVARLDGSGKIGDGDRMTAFPAPDIREQSLSGIDWNGCP